jgi:pimeloyl-ACP methyl ester carboxylesterase
MPSVELSFQIIGDPAFPPLMIMHGLFGSGRNWNALARKFSEHFSVYTLDMRNHGNSPHSGEMNYPIMAQDVATFMDKEGLESASIVAHSMGGKAAMWLALTQPERIDKLVSVDIAPVHYDHCFSEILKGLNGIPLELVTSRKEADNYLSKILPDVGLRQFLLQNLVIKSGQCSWRVNLSVIEQVIEEILAFPATDHVAPFAKAALFIGGGQSDYILPEHMPAIEEFFPQAKIETIFNAGHWLHAEQPAKFIEISNRFLLA